MIVAAWRSMVAAVFAALLLLSACGRPERAPPKDDEIPPCWVYKGLSEEKIKRMEEYCNEYAVCGDKDGEACSGMTGEVEP